MEKSFKEYFEESLKSDFFPKEAKGEIVDSLSKSINKNLREIESGDVKVLMESVLVKDDSELANIEPSKLTRTVVKDIETDLNLLYDTIDIIVRFTGRKGKFFTFDLSFLPSK